MRQTWEITAQRRPGLPIESETWLSRPAASLRRELRQIVHALESAPGHVLPEEHFLSFLETHFGADEAQAQLETAINWGRYAELFTFQEDRGIFRLEEPEAAESA